MAHIKLHSKEDVRLAIRRRGHQIAASLSNAEFFGSHQFRNYAEKLVDFILRKHKLFKMVFLHNENSDTTAFTDGKTITVNTGNVLITHSKILERRFKSAMGMIFHEAAHKLFLDWVAHEQIVNTLLAGKPFGTFPTNSDPELVKAKEELEKVIGSVYAPAVTEIYCNLANIINDGHDEAALCRCFPGFITDCIKTVNEVMLELTPALNELIDKRIDDFGIYTSLLLQYAKNGFYKECVHNADTDKYLNDMIPLEETVDRMLEEDDYTARWDLLNLLVLQLWHSLRTKFPEQPETQSQSGSGNGTLSVQEVVNAIKEAAQQTAKNANAAPVPKNCSGETAVSVSVVATGGTPASEGDANSLALSVGDEQA